jgi:Domain of unknown function (DUF4386)
MVVSGDASATANILKNELLYRLGCVAAIILLCCNVPWALIYELFKLVNRILSGFVAMFILVAAAIEISNALNFYAPDPLRRPLPEQVQSGTVGKSLAYMFQGRPCQEQSLRWTSAADLSGSGARRGT